MLLLSVLSLLFFISCKKDESPSGPSEPVGVLYEVGDIKIPVLTGTPYQMGKQLGDLMGSEIQDFYNSMIEQQFDHGYYDYMEVLDQTNELWDNVIPPWLKAICDGMSVSSGMELDELKIMQVFSIIELMNEACSAIIAWQNFTEDGNLIFGYNHDSEQEALFSFLVCVTVYKFSDAPHKFATVGFPGIIPVLTGINDIGLCVAINAAPMSNVFEDYNLDVPWRQIRSFEWLMNLSNVEQLRSTYFESPVSIGCNYLIADKYSAACFETAVDNIQEKEADAEGLIAETNHYTHSLLEGHNELYFEENENTSHLRYLNLLNCAQSMQGNIAMDDIMGSVLRVPENQGGVMNRTAISVVFKPMVMQLLIYSHNQGEAVEINLSNYLN